MASCNPFHFYMKIYQMLFCISKFESVRIHSKFAKVSIRQKFKHNKFAKICTHGIYYRVNSRNLVLTKINPLEVNSRNTSNKQSACVFLSRYDDGEIVSEGESSEVDESKTGLEDLISEEFKKRRVSL